MEKNPKGAGKSSDFLRTYYTIYLYCVCALDWLRDVIKIFWRCYLLKDLRISVCFTCKPNNMAMKATFKSQRIESIFKYCCKNCYIYGLHTLPGSPFVAHFVTQCTQTRSVNKSMLGLTTFCCLYVPTYISTKEHSMHRSTNEK